MLFRSRANRVFPGKVAGQIVDCINIFGQLQYALGMYGGGDNFKDTDEPVDSPADHKQVLFEELKNAINDVTEFLAEQKISLQNIIDASTEDLKKLELLDEASEILLSPNLRDKFAGFVRQINRIFKAILPDQNAYKYIKQRVALSVIYRQMRLKSGLDVDDQDVLDVVRTQVNEQIGRASCRERV